jgi:hypothetical protein
MAFILDGYNECAQQRRAHLTRVFSAAARRYEASAVVTTQIPLEQDELLSLTTVEILEPSIATKRRIAEIAAEIDLQDASIEPLLEFVRNGFEARLVGEVGRAVPVGGSRYSIFDRYVRKRLGEDASEGITALAHIAHLFSQRIAFSMTARDRDRLAEAERIPVHLLARLQNANLFVERAGRASFGHELLLNAFSAEAVVRRAAGDADAILAALASPQNAERKTLIVGAIDEEALAVRVLSAVSDPAIIEDCVAGQCGRLAQDWVERRCREVMTRLREETMQLSFLIDEKGFMGIRPDPETLLAWTPTDRAVLATFPRLIAQGRYLDDLLRIAREMDTILAQEHARLREMLEGKKIALRSALFAASYFWHGHNAPALSAICSPLHSGVSLWAKRPPYWDQITKQLARDNLSHGELYILLLIYRHAGFDGPSITHLLPGLLKHFWRSAAYHLRLELMDRAHSGAFRATEEDRIKLVEAIEDLLSKTDDVLMSTSMLDVLKNLGALDDSQAEHTETVRENIREVLAGADDPDMQALAFGVWYGQFDHPYDGAYYEALSELCPADKKALLWMAAQGANDDSPFISCLLVELASFSDPAAGAIIARWTALLPKKIVMRQDAIGNFASAYITLGRLGCALPKIDEIGEEADSAAALAACGRIFYWLNRADLPMEDRRAAAAQAVAVLSNQKNIATSVLNEFYRVDMLTREALDQLPGTEPAQTSIGACFPSEIAEMARVCLSHPSCQHGYFDWFEARSTFDFAIQALGFWGTVADIPLLRAWAVDPSSGTLAVDAIKKLEQCYLLPRSA